MYLFYINHEVYTIFETVSYFITKDHCFTDGNKRIAAAIFLYFLDKNQSLFEDGQKCIEDHTLVALIIMIAESQRQEKEIMVRLVMNFIS